MNQTPHFLASMDASEAPTEHLTYSQRWALGVMARSNLNVGRPVTDWVNQHDERIHKGSIRALERRGLVAYSPDLGIVRALRTIDALACMHSIEGDPR